MVLLRDRVAIAADNICVDSALPFPISGDRWRQPLL